MKLCVFCGSAAGKDAAYAESARKLGELMALSGATLVYGGGNVGLMGVLADAVMKGGGEVIGVIPDFLLKREVGHNGISKLEVVSSMHQRKKRMAELADAFLAIPGGWGTLDELAEILTWKQLGIIHQPIGLLNYNRFFDHLLNQMRHMVDQGFLKPECFGYLQVADSPENALSMLIPQKR